MANHVRQQLREAVATAVTGLTTTSTRVFQSRAYPLQTSDLPCLVVTTDGDSMEYLTVKKPSQLQRDTQVRIEAYATGTSNLDDTLDTICKEVEIAMDNLSTIAKSVGFVGTQLNIDVVSEKPVGKATLIYRMQLLTLSNAPDVAI